MLARLINAVWQYMDTDSCAEQMGRSTPVKQEYYIEGGINGLREF